MEPHSLSELDPAARERAIAWMREAEANDYSPADVIDDCLTCLQFLGIDVDNDRKGRPAVEYSVGGNDDYVAFCGGWRVADMDVAGLLAYAPQDDALHRVASQFTAILLQWPLATAGIGHTGQRFVIDVDYGDDVPCDGKTLIQLLLVAVKAAAAWMLARMQADYEWRTSDEACIDCIEANDYRFTKAGEFVPEVPA